MSDCIVRDDFELRYVSEGVGPDMLVVGSAVYYPRVFSPELRKNFRITFIDHRGFGTYLGEGKPPVCDLDTVLEDIEALRIHLNLRDVVIVGHSGHAFMALEYAKKYPESVSKVVLLNFGPDYGPKHSKMADQYFAETADAGRKVELEKGLALLEREIAAAPEKRFITFCLRLGARSWYDAKFDATVLWNGVAVNMEIIDHLWGVVFRDIDIRRDLTNMKKPVFLGLGLFDYLVPPFFTWQEYRDLFQNLTVRIFPRSGHTPSMEEPEVFDKELMNWVSRS